MFSLEKLLRNNIRSIKPYSSARDEYSGKTGVFLDANENPLGSVGLSGYNRYPDPYQSELKSVISVLKNIAAEHIFLGNGSDEPIDLLFRAFCEPRIDNVIVTPPTYGMYRVCADINDIEVKEVNLTEEFELQTEKVLSAVNENTKLIWLCSPNNPSGNLMQRASVEKILKEFNGIVVVDEAYIDFSEEPSFITELKNYPNLVVLQTFSKAWGLAALRLGMAFASAEIVQVLSKIKYPYNINLSTQKLALDALRKAEEKDQFVEEILKERDNLKAELSKFSAVTKIFPSEANFLLIRIDNARKIFDQLIAQLVIVRDRSSVVLCKDCLRITVGTKDENNTLLKELGKIL